jgi:hypothetical protein
MAALLYLLLLLILSLWAIANAGNSVKSAKTKIVFIPVEF